MTARKASDEKAKLILQAAGKVLMRQGYARTTIKEVAAEAGVSRGLLHYYFKNKEEMLFMIESWALARQNTSAHEELQSIYNLLRQGLANGLENTIERGVLKTSTPVLQIATVLIAFVDGLSFELMLLSGLREDAEFWQTSQRALEAVLKSF